MVETLKDLYRAHIDVLSARTSEALQAEGLDALVIHSGSLAKKSQFDDQYWPLRPVPHFQHWAHLQWPDCALYLRAGHRPVLLAVRDRSFWERAPEPDWELLGQGFQIEHLDDPAEVRAHLEGNQRTAFVGEDMTRARDWALAEINPGGLMGRLDDLRVFKTPYEVRCLDEANRIAAAGHLAVKSAFEAGERSELRLHLAYLDATRQDDPQTPYKNIVAVGESAAILHHVHYQRRSEASKSLLLDAGATCNGYASDITRTYCATDGSTATDLFSTLIDRVEGMQQALCQNVRIGRPYEELHDEAHARLSRILVDLGIVKMSPEACLETGISRMFLPHGLGHSLGLQCHDVGCAKIRPREDNAWLRNTRPIESGQVFTIEPGVYFIDTFLEELEGGPHRGHIDWAAIEALRPFGGIRIEDDLVVTEGEHDNLTRRALQPPESA